MHKYKVLTLTLLISVAGSTALQAATETKNLQTLPATTEAVPANSTQTDPENDALANEAGKDFSEGAKGLGRGFTKGAKVTGKAFQKAGTTMGRGFKRAGSAIRDYFAGKPEVEERDLNTPASETESETEVAPRGASDELDAVGNDLPKKAESKRLSQDNSTAEQKSNESALF